MVNALLHNKNTAMTNNDPQGTAKSIMYAVLLTLPDFYDILRRFPEFGK